MAQEISALFATTKSIRVDNESYFGSRLRLLYQFIVFFFSITLFKQDIFNFGLITIPRIFGNNNL